MQNIKQMGFSTNQSKQSFPQFGDMYSLSKSLLLTFDDFYKTIPNKVSQQQQIVYVKKDELNFDQVLGVYIEDNLILKRFQKSKQKQLWEEKQTLQINPLGTNFFKNILKNLKFQYSQKQLNLQQLSRQTFEMQSTASPDLLVKDIYGPDSTSIGLPENLLASSLGKLTKSQICKYRKQQIIRSVLIALAVNSAQNIGLCSLCNGIKNIVIMKNDFDSLAFNRFIYSLLMFFNPDATLYFKAQNSQNSFFGMSNSKN